MSKLAFLIGNLGRDCGVYKTMDTKTDIDKKKKNSRSMKSFQKVNSVQNVVKPRLSQRVFRNSPI